MNKPTLKAAATEALAILEEAIELFGSGERGDQVVANLRFALAEEPAEIDALKAENERLRKDADRLKTVRELCGYVEDGSCQILTIFQDDASCGWSIKIDGRQKYYGESFGQTIDAAMKDFSTT